MIGAGPWPHTHPGATKRPGQQLSLAWGRVRAVTVTSEHPLNVTSPTDIDRCCRCRRPTSSGYPGPEGPGLRRPNTRSLSKGGWGQGLVDKLGPVTSCVQAPEGLGEGVGPDRRRAGARRDDVDNRHGWFFLSLPGKWREASSC